VVTWDIRRKKPVSRLAPGSVQISGDTQPPGIRSGEVLAQHRCQNRFATARARIERRRQYRCVCRNESEYPAKANYRYKEEVDPGPSRINALRGHLISNKLSAHIKQPKATRRHLHLPAPRLRHAGTLESPAISGTKQNTRLTHFAQSALERDTSRRCRSAMAHSKLRVALSAGSSKHPTPNFLHSAISDRRCKFSFTERLRDGLGEPLLRSDVGGTRAPECFRRWAFFF